ncbi:hypothetical protein FN960_16880 [Alkalicoccobacillus porphyridii]|uniref:Uncharacterized protein n=1 Tax=Alkalicoccobacillus porphyridii TaxID=2597270 RepID=A0A553ZV52_9BACI|nr:hypothetical protein FN960_16880 [Alkalicoccobacillus porphyridii]
MKMRGKHRVMRGKIKPMRDKNENARKSRLRARKPVSAANHLNRNVGPLSDWKTYAEGENESSPGQHVADRRLPTIFIRLMSDGFHIRDDTYRVYITFLQPTQEVPNGL